MIVGEKVGFRIGKPHIFPLEGHKYGDGSNDQQDQDSVAQDDPGGSCPKTIHTISYHFAGGKSPVP
jgi:hypothetical protein